ncbi:hypothetical protein N4I61_002003 [Escherichia coli]|nr:hypothetical protein [Escherichia coli]
MQDKILRRVWGFDVKEQAYENYQAGQDSVLTGIAVFVKNGTLAQVKIIMEFCR